MEQRAFGNTGIKVSALGFGAGNTGDPAMSETDVERLLHGVVDCGITLIDSARAYGLSEERIGRHLSKKRDAIVLSTKVGYGIPGYQDWTGPCISAGIDAALQRMRTDTIDIVHLHSCPLETLEKPEILQALSTARKQGKIRVAAYSGDNEPLRWAIGSEHIGSVQTSINVCDQQALDSPMQSIQQRGLGLIAKRPLANAPWLHSARPTMDTASGIYWDRWNAMQLRSLSTDPADLALRFVAHLEGVHSCIIGSRNIDHVRKNVESFSRGPLSKEMHSLIRKAFDKTWEGQI